MTAFRADEQVATHGRLGSARDSWSFANGLLGHAGTLRGEAERDLIIVTLVSFLIRILQIEPS